jgi:two-component system phosphate regulon sensor histidine kinase PhoR
MDALGATSLLTILGVLEVFQLFVFWAYIQRRYRLSVRQLNRVTGLLAAGKRPATFYIGGTKPLEAVSRDLEAIGLLLDDFEREKREEDFNLNVLLANMVEGVMVVDQRHVVRLANDELLNLFDLKQSPVGRTVLEALRESRIELIVRQTIARGEPRRHEVVLAASAGPQRHFEISAVPVRTKTSEVEGAVLVFHDISRIKQLEEVRAEFVANVSHELRTPLAIFRGYLETLRDNPGLPTEETQRMVSAMDRHSHRLHALVEDLLALTRLDSRPAPVEFSSIRVEAFLRQLVDDWQNQSGGEAAEIDLRVPSDLPPLEVNPLRFGQVMLNLLENAVAYSSPPRRLVVSAEAQGRSIEIRVADNGIGIPPGDLPYIFQRFYRVDKARSRASGGTGLGLSIVRTIVESHGGTVTAESEVGKGTTIILKLPMRQEEGQG